MDSSAFFQYPSDTVSDRGPGRSGARAALRTRNPQQYLKLAFGNGKVCGAILIGYPELTETVSRAAKDSVDVTPVLASLERGDWSVLER